MEQWVLTNILGPVGALVITVVAVIILDKRNNKHVTIRMSQTQKQLDDCHLAHRETQSTLLKLTEDYGVLKGKVEQIELNNTFYVKIESALQDLKREG